MDWSVLPPAVQQAAAAVVIISVLRTAMVAALEYAGEYGVLLLADDFLSFAGNACNISFLIIVTIT